MKRHLDVEEILTELQALAEKSVGPATVAILACMDVVERHGRIADEAELKARVPEAGPTLVQHRTGQPEPALLDSIVAEHERISELIADGTVMWADFREHDPYACPKCTNVPRPKPTPPERFKRGGRL